MVKSPVSVNDVYVALVPATKFVLLNTNIFVLLKVSAPAIVNIFPVTVTHLPLNPTSGKSSQSRPVASARILNSYHEPVGLLVSDIAIRIDEVVACGP